MLGVSYALLAAVFGSPFLAGQRNYAPDEIRLSSRRYVPSQSMVRVQSNEVQIDVVVRDSHSQPVVGLKAEDFEIFDEGRRQTIASFISESSSLSEESASSAVGGDGNTATSSTQDHYIVLFLDDINTENSDLSRASLAARKFILDGMEPRDFVSIATSSGSSASEFTKDRRSLLDILAKVRLHARYSFRGEPPCNVAGYEAYLITELNDSDEVMHLAKCISQHFMVPADNTPFSPAANLARADANRVWGSLKFAIQDTFASIRGALDSLSSQPGSRVFLLASSGFISDPLGQAKDEIEAEALRAHILINCLDAKGLYAELLGPPLGDPHAEDSPDQLIRQVETLGARLQTGNAVMAEFSQATGGRFIENNNDLIGGVRSLAGSPRVRYFISFAAPSEFNDGKFHKLKIRLIPAHYSIQARPGYFAPTKEQLERIPPQTKLDHAVESSADIRDIPATASHQLLKSSTASPNLSVTVHVDLRPLEFQTQSDREVQQLNFVIALFDPQGRFVAGKEGEIDLELKQDSFARLRAEGINGTLSLDAPSGEYRLRVVTQEAVNGKLAAFSQPVQIR